MMRRGGLSLVAVSQSPACSRPASRRAARRPARARSRKASRSRAGSHEPPLHQPDRRAVVQRLLARLQRQAGPLQGTPAGRELRAADVEDAPVGDPGRAQAHASATSSRRAAEYVIGGLGCQHADRLGKKETFTAVVCRIAVGVGDSTCTAQVADTSPRRAPHPPTGTVTFQALRGNMARAVSCERHAGLAGNRELHGPLHAAELLPYRRASAGRRPLRRRRQLRAVLRRPHLHPGAPLSSRAR